MHTHTHTEEYYFFLKKEEILSLTTTLMNLEDIILNYRSQTQEDKYCMNSLTWGL